MQKTILIELRREDCNVNQSYEEEYRSSGTKSGSNQEH
jgi:hypothetical protein